MRHLPELGDEPRERIPTKHDPWAVLRDEMLKLSQEQHELRDQILIDFYNTVCDRAEANMKATGTVSGAHWNAMRQVLTEMGIEATR